MTRLAIPAVVLLVGLGLAGPVRAQNADRPTELWSEYPLEPKVQQAAPSPVGPFLPPGNAGSPITDESSGSSYWLPLLVASAIALALAMRLARPLSATGAHVIEGRVAALRGRGRRLWPRRFGPARPRSPTRSRARSAVPCDTQTSGEVWGMSAIASKSVVTPIGEAATRRPSAAVPDYIERNRAEWERWWPSYVERGREAWAADELRWGIWGIPESELRLVDGLEAGADVIELGCGTAAICAWLARRGFSPIGVDITRPLLEKAAEFEREFRVEFPLLCANAEQLHFEDASFDCAISEYGASLWCDPHRWVAEAARLLRPNGLLVFVTNSALLVSCTPNDGASAGDRVVRDYFSRYRVEFEGTDAVEFHLNHGNWVRLLRTNGFVIENLVEPRPPEGATPSPFASAAWAQLSPSEEIWIARKAPRPSSSDDSSEPGVLTAGPDLPPPPEDPEIPPDEAAGSATATSEEEPRPGGSASHPRPRSRKGRARRHGRSRR